MYVSEERLFFLSDFTLFDRSANRCHSLTSGFIRGLLDRRVSLASW